MDALTLFKAAVMSLLVPVLLMVGGTLKWPHT
jgi:hypothetical protein